MTPSCTTVSPPACTNRFDGNVGSPISVGPPSAVKPRSTIANEHSARDRSAGAAAGTKRARVDHGTRLCHSVVTRRSRSPACSSSVVVTSTSTSGPPSRDGQRYVDVIRSRRPQRTGLFDRDVDSLRRRRPRRRCRVGTSCTCHPRRRRARCRPNPSRPSTDHVPSSATSTRTSPFDSDRPSATTGSTSSGCRRPCAPAVPGMSATRRAASASAACGRGGARCPTRMRRSRRARHGSPDVSIDPSRSRSARHSSSPVSTDSSAIASIRRLCFSSRTTTAAMVDEVELRSARARPGAR